MDPTRLPDHLVRDGRLTAAVVRQLEQARQEAVDAILEAEELERNARTARRRATSLLKRYERMVQEHSGQLTISDA